MPGYYARRRRLGSKRHGRPAIVYFAALTALALLFSVAGPSATATVTTGPAGATSVPILSLSQWAASPGSRVTASGTGFQPGSTVNVRVGSGPGGLRSAARVDRAGYVTAVIAIPVGSRPGWEEVVLTGTVPGSKALVEEVALQVD